MTIDPGRSSWVRAGDLRRAKKECAPCDDRECESYYYCSHIMRNTPSASLLTVIALSSLASVASVASVASAQVAVELPALSPKARVEQRVGITDVSIDYSSPAIKGRKIWGDLVPYDKVWRAGANQATKLTVSRDFKFGGTVVKAGSYSVFMTPSKASWTVALNSDVAATQDNVDAAKHVATTTVKPTAMPAARERLRYTFDDTQDDRTMLTLEWERVRVAVPITIDTAALVNTNIERATNAVWRPHFASAAYLHEAGQTDRALQLVERSIAIHAHWQNEWLRAQILQKKGNKAEAKASAAKAQELGKGDQGFEQFGKATIQKTVAGWK
jgi:hypothetical protein